MFQFQGSLDWPWKHRRKESSTMAAAASCTKELISNRSRLCATRNPSSHTLSDATTVLSAKVLLLHLQTTLLACCSRMSGSLRASEIAAFVMAMAMQPQ